MSCLLYDFFTVVCITVFIKHLKVKFIFLKFDRGYAEKMAIFQFVKLLVFLNPSR